MNNEIKEKKTKRIIEKIEGLATYVTIPRELAIYNVNIDSQEAKLLIDYITNLQQENEELKLELSGYREAILRDDKLLGLQETIDFQDKWVEYYKDFISENNIKDYKSRCKKAVEYIKENCITSDSWKDLGFCNFVPTGEITYKQLCKNKIRELLNILNGRSDE